MRLNFRNTSIITFTASLKLTYTILVEKWRKVINMQQKGSCVDGFFKISVQELAKPIPIELLLGPERKKEKVKTRQFPGWWGALLVHWWGITSRLGRYLPPSWLDLVWLQKPIFWSHNTAFDKSKVDGRQRVWSAVGRGVSARLGHNPSSYNLHPSHQPPWCQIVFGKHMECICISTNLPELSKCIWKTFRMYLSAGYSGALRVGAFQQRAKCISSA